MRVVVTDELLRGTLLEHPLVHKHLCDRLILDSLEEKDVRQIGEPIRDDEVNTGSRPCTSEDVQEF